jgi:hypothetical protein
MTEFYEGILPVAVRRKLDSFRKKINELETENLVLLAEIDEWKAASGLEIGGDPDGVTPKACRDYWENFELINTSPTLYWSHVPTTGDDPGWNLLVCLPDHPQQPKLQVVRLMDKAHGAQVMITAREKDGDEEIIVADVIVPFRDDLADCSICDGKGWTISSGGVGDDCPWCWGDKRSAMDEAREIACALYWSWLRSPNGGGEKHCLGRFEDVELVRRVRSR